MTYWVSTDLLKGDWSELPIVTPDQIKRFKEDQVRLHRPTRQSHLHQSSLQRVEKKHLLKCQIVRISFSCQIVPRTMFNVNAEDKKEVEPAPEEWKLPGFTFLSSLENWVHQPQNVLKNGRLTLLKPVIPEGVEVDEEKLMK